MKLYSDFASHRFRQIVADLVALALIAGALFLGLFVHSLVMDLAAIGAQVETAGEGFAQSMGDVGEKVSGVPLLGPGAQNLFNGAGGAGGVLADAGRTGQTAVGNLALGFGGAIALFPTALTLVLWLGPRMRFARRAGVARRLGSQAGSRNLLALRALTTHKLKSLEANSAPLESRSVVSVSFLRRPQQHHASAPALPRLA